MLLYFSKIGTPLKLPRWGFLFLFFYFTLVSWKSITGTSSRGAQDAPVQVTLLERAERRIRAGYTHQIENELLNPESLVGSGLESWAEPSDMASFIFWLRLIGHVKVHG